jgi:hypothetical protein
MSLCTMLTFLIFLESRDQTHDNYSYDEMHLSIGAVVVYRKSVPGSHLSASLTISPALTNI